MDDSPTSTQERRSPEDWLILAKQAEQRGELLEAYDIAERGLAQHPEDLWLRHRAVLALARAGATQMAAQRFREYGLDRSDDAQGEIPSLGARIAKDQALHAGGGVRRQRAAEAAALYEAVYRRTGGYYPGINAATLSLIAGEPAKAASLADQVLAVCRSADDEPYYRKATEAEAYLLLNRPDAAAEALERAATLHGGDFAAVASTRKQLRLICDTQGIDAAVLVPLSPPRVIHYCGHRIAPEGETGRFPADAEAQVAAHIAEALDQGQVGFGYGSLASGADILLAEALLARGAELNVVLPFAAEEFEAISVAPSAGRWPERFRRCLTRAKRKTFATEDQYLNDTFLFRYASDLAMGLAVLRSRYLDAEVGQIAVWDGVEARSPAGTGADVAAWKRLGLPQTFIALPTGAGAGSLPGTESDPGGHRVIRAMLFGDVKGFSKLGDAELPRFIEHVLGGFAAVLRRYGAEVKFRNTWGDGLFVVFEDAARAASCASELQASMLQLDLAAAELPGHLALRLGGHLGPVYEATDPVLQITNVFGAHVSRTARIEPVTPPGSVYVTEPFAARLALDPASGFTCDYVGQMPAAKGYGYLRMYLLRPSPQLVGQGAGGS